MSEAAIAEEVIASPDSQPSTPASEAVLESTPTPEATPSTSTGAETPEGAGEGLEVAAKPLDQWTLQELNEKAYRDGLTAEETRRRDSLHQSMQDRAAYEQRTLQEAERLQREHVARLESAYDTRAAFVNDQIEKLLSGQDAELTRERVTRALSELKTEAQFIHDAAYHRDLDAALLHPAYFGDSVRNRQALAQMSVLEKAQQLALLSFNKGRQMGPDDDHVVLKKAELTDREKKAAAKALDDFKAANPGLAPPSGGGTGGGALPGMTLAEIDAMPTSVWLSRYSASEREQLLTNARRQG